MTSGSNFQINPETLKFLFSKKYHLKLEMGS